MIIQRTVAVAAGAVNDNLFAGSTYEYLTGRAVVQLAVNSSDPDTFVTIFLGPRVIAEEFIPFQGTDYPIIPDGFYYTAAGVGNERIVMRARNADAAAQTFRAIAQITLV